MSVFKLLIVPRLADVYGRIPAPRVVVLAVAALVIPSHATPVRAADDETKSTFPEVVVSASRVPIPARESGSAITVIDETVLEERQVRIVSDVLRDIPGVAVNRSGTMGGLTQIRIRGAEGNQTLVLIDGIEVNNPAGASEYQFQNLLNAGIARIEVLRGPQSALWGSDAIGGVINVVTERPGRGWSLTARGEGGSFATSDGLGYFGYGGDRFYVSGILNRFDTGGISIADEDAGNDEEDAYENLTGRLKAGMRIAPNLDIELVGMRVDSTFDNDDSVPVVNIVDGDTTSETEQRYALAKATWTTFGGAWEHVIRAARADDETEFFDGAGANTFSSHGAKSKLDYQTNILFETPSVGGARHTLTFAAEREEDEQFTNSGFFGPNTVTIENYGYVGEYRVSLWDRLFLSGALRFDDNDDLFEDAVTWRGTAAYDVKSLGLRLHGSAASGVKNPTLFELFGATPSFSGNPDLSPEKARGFDLGVEKSFLGGRAKADVTVFANWIEDLIQGAGNTAENIEGTSRTRGLELTLAAEPLNGLRLDASYTYLHAEDAEGNRLIRRPRHIGSANARYRFTVWGRPATVNLGVRYNGSQTDTVFNSFFPVETVTVELDGYTLVNAGFQWQLTDRLQVFFRGENLLDADYQEVFGFGAPGIAAFGGVKLALGSAPDSRKGAP